MRKVPRQFANKDLPGRAGADLQQREQLALKRLQLKRLPLISQRKRGAGRWLASAGGGWVVGGGFAAVRASARVHHLRRCRSQINLRQNNYGKLMGARVADGYTAERRRRGGGGGACTSKWA